MMKMVQCPKWETSDGHKFDSRDSAAEHECMLALARLTGASVDVTLEDKWRELWKKRGAVMALYADLEGPCYGETTHVARPPDLLARARSFVRSEASETKAGVIIMQLAREIERLRTELGWA